VLAQAEAAHVFSQDSIQSQANMLGMLVSVGLPASTFDDYVSNLRQVTPEDIQRVANQYLQLDQSTVAILDPSGETNRRPAARPDFGGRSH
jgi:zinc protease